MLSVGNKNLFLMFFNIKLYRFVRSFFLHFEAEAKKIAADAEAEANKKIADSLTPELIEKIKYEQWNGELPQVQGSNTPIVNMGE